MNRWEKHINKITAIIIANLIKQVEEAKTKDDLLKLLTELQDEIADLNNKFTSAYQSKNYDAARNHLVKMKYFISIENTTKDKILQFWKGCTLFNMKRSAIWWIILLIKWPLCY